MSKYTLRQLMRGTRPEWTIHVVKDEAKLRGRHICGI